MHTPSPLSWQTTSGVYDVTPRSNRALTRTRSRAGKLSTFLVCILGPRTRTQDVVPPQIPSFPVLERRVSSLCAGVVEPGAQCECAGSAPPSPIGTRSNRLVKQMKRRGYSRDAARLCCAQTRRPSPRSRTFSPQIVRQACAAERPRYARVVRSSDNEEAQQVLWRAKVR